MTDKDIIRAEIFRRYAHHGTFEGVIAETREDECSSILDFIDSMQENPCNGCTNRKGCITCENGELRETVHEEPISNPIDFEKELYKAFGQVKDFTLGMRIAKWFYDMGKNSQEPVSEKKCMFTGDNYTDEDRKVLCEGCEAERKYSKQSVDEAMAEIEEKAKAFTKAHKGESADEILSEMRGEEPISEDFKLFEKEYLEKEKDEILCVYDRHAGLVDGAKWQKEQFEKNRLKHCNSITNEQAELEQGFIDQHLDKYQRMPTFLDAIEYGMRLQKQQMMKDAIDAEITYGKSLAIPSLGYKLDKEGLDYGDKVKVIIIKK